MKLPTQEKKDDVHLPTQEKKDDVHLPTQKKRDDVHWWIALREGNLAQFELFSKIY